MIAVLRSSLLLSTLLCGLFATSACSWLHTPTSSDKFELQWAVQESTRTAPHAQLTLTDRGFWAYLPEKRKNFEPRWTPGRLLVFKSEEGSHYFLVVQSGSWGYRLQRLDDKALPKIMEGDLQVLELDDIDGNPDLCLVDTIDVEECMDTEYHSRWRLFDVATDESGLSILADFGDIRNQPGFPARPRAVAGGEFSYRWAEGNTDRVHGRILAIRATPAVEATFRATVVYDDSCIADLDSSALVEARPGRLSETTRDHPIAIEDATYRLSADAIIECRNDDPYLLVPALSRPLLRGPEGTFFGPPSLGMAPRRLVAVTPDTIDNWARIGALVAVGETQVAAFWIDQVIGQMPLKSLAQRELLLSTMSVLASSGYPELAIRIGRHLTEGAWNPENIPDYLDGLIVLLDLIGDHNAYSERVDHRETLAKRRLDEHRRGWYRWADIRLRLAHRRGTYGPAYRQVIAEFEEEELDEWALAVWATLQMHGLELPVVSSPEELLPRFSDAGAGALWNYLITSDDAGLYDDSEERLLPTPYGWTEATAGGDPDINTRLRTSAPLDARRGFAFATIRRKSEDFDTAREQLEFWLAVAPLAPTEETLEVNEAILESLVKWTEADGTTFCDELPLLRSRFRNTAARARAPAVDRQRRQWITSLNWWSEHGLETLCGSVEDFLNAVEDHVSEENPWMRSIFPLLERKLLDASETGLEPMLLDRVSRLARQIGDHHSCTVWSLAISVAAAQSGLFDVAESHLIGATNCLTAESDLRATRNLVAAYLDFERAAGQNLITDGGVENALARATRRRIDDTDICVGLLPIGFHLESQLPATLMEIANQVHLAPPTGEELVLQTASAFVDEARAAYVSGIRDLARGELLGAARALERSRSNFRRIQHLPGLTRIAFLDEVIFDGQMEAIAETGELGLSRSDDEIEALRSGQGRRLLARILDRPSEDWSRDDAGAVIAALIVERREHDIETYFPVTSLPTGLCSPPRSHDVPVGDSQ